MIYLWCNTHKREDTGSFFFCLGLEKRREKRVPAAEVAASDLMNRKVGWSELSCINTNS